MADLVPGSKLTTYTLSVNSSVTSAIDYSLDTDWYAVNLTAGVNYQIDLLGRGGDGALAGLSLTDPYLVIRNSDGTVLYANDDAGLGLNARIFFTPTVSGTYFLDAQDSWGNATGSYRLVVNSYPVIGALTLGVSQTGTIGFAGEVNLYSVSLTAGTTYHFSVDGATLADPYLEILNSAGTTQDADDDGGPGLNAYLAFTPTTSGTYYLAARESGNNATGTYTARMWQTPTVSIAGASVTEGHSGTTNLVFTLSLSNASPVPVSVTASTLGSSTATAGGDYGIASSTITFAPGQTTASFTVPVRGDTVFEPTEILYVDLSSPQGAILDSSRWRGLGLVIDDDSPYSLPADEMLTLQWHLYPGAGANVFPVWSDYTGHGVRVAVFDQGIDPFQSDLDSNLLTSLGRRASNLTSGGAPILSTDNHGTAVAGTIAAERNGTGVVGVAYGADLVSIYSQLTDAEIPNAFAYAANFDVLNNSWGYAPQGYTYPWQHWAFADNFETSAFSAAGAALANLAANGRKGLGTVVVQSAGNSFGYGDDTNLHNFQNSQYIITVAATDYFGNVTSYSSPGASVLVAAPGGGGDDLLSNIITTDRVGGAGYASGDITSITGTSFSAPIVSGIVALMLEANPSLGYRDVQEILAYSARKISADRNDWKYNGATNWNGGGLHYDALNFNATDAGHNLGFGLVDARAAVRLAETWTTSAQVAANREQVSISRSPAQTIPDNFAGVASDRIAITQDIQVERAEVTLHVTHPYVGDLSVFLRSPSGTVSTLLWRPQQNALSAYGTNQNDIHFTFDTVLGWGESALGNWEIGVIDMAIGYVGRLDSWTLNLIGKPASADDAYIYTDEFSEVCLDQATRALLTDSGGTDTLNAAACTSNLVLNLAPGAVSTIDGQSLALGVSTIIENAYGGDGNDTILGNDATNVLRGMRGNDTLDGKGGVDVAVFAGKASNYTIAKTSTGYTVKDNVGSDGVDALQNIERLMFANNEILPLSRDGVEIEFSEPKTPRKNYFLLTLLPEKTDIVAKFRTQDFLSTATAGQDYLSANQTVTIPAGTEKYAFAVDILSNRYAEQKESIVAEVTLEILGQPTVTLTATHFILAHAAW